MGAYFNKIKDFVLQDVKNENEIKKAAVILRMIFIVMWVYYLGIFAETLLLGNRMAAGLSLLGIGAYVALFLCTYHNMTKQVALTANFLIAAWVVFLSLAYGNGTGVLGFTYILIVLLYIMDYLNLAWKVVYVLILLLGQMFLYRYMQEAIPYYAVGEEPLFAFHIMDSAVTGISLLVAVTVATRDSWEMEKKLISYNKKLHRLANRDALTGLGNRRNIMEYMNQKAQEYESGAIPALSIAIADIDYFKKINDTYGHGCGDMVLKKLAETLEAFMENKGKVGRWGGEEFLFVFKNCNGDEAHYTLSRLQHIVRDMEFPYSDQVVRLTLTFGLAEYDSAQGLENTINEADEKLYMGKEKGRNIIIY